MANPWSRKPKKPSFKGLVRDNGKAPTKPSLASLVKGKPKVNLGVALGIKPPVVEERPYQAPKPRAKEDFRFDGILFSGAEVSGQFSSGYKDGVYRPVGSVDVTNGDQTYTMHNRYGSWMHDVWQGGGRMAEPARVAAWLGIQMSQMQMSQALTRRFEAELKKQGILTAHQQRARLEAEAAEARKRPKKTETTEMTRKVSMRSLLQK